MTGDQGDLFPEGPFFVRNRDFTRCDGCGQEDIGLLGPMVHDDIWRQIAAPSEFLCGACMHARITERLGRPLALTDLLPCPWNDPFMRSER